MRAADRTLPPVDPHPMPDAPLRPVIAVEPLPLVFTWDDPLLVWDDGASSWDYTPAPGPWSDAYCDAFGMSLEAGHPDEHAVFDTGRLVVQIDNKSGRWSQYNVDGSLVAYGPGRHVAVWAVDGAGGAWWLFYGRVSRWDELSNDVVEVEAFDPQSDLAQPIGATTFGVNGDKPGVRVGKILTAAGYTDRTNVAAGLVTLTAQVTDAAPLEELQTVATSDGGVFYADADGTLVYADRAWRGGRADQVSVPTVSDNICSGPLIVWNLVLSANDQFLADQVILENIAGLRSTARVVTPTGAYVLAATDLQWTTQLEGDTLAAQLLATQSRPRTSIDGLDVYLFDPRQPAAAVAVGWRLLDRLRLLHTAHVQGGLATLDVTALIVSIDHDWTPGAWIMSVSTTRAVDYARPINWDTPPYVWDDPSPAAVWSF